MICLNDVFAWKRPDVMDARFPDSDWRRKMAESQAGLGDWGWFWAGFAPKGMLMNAPAEACEKDGPREVWSLEDMAPAVLKACAEGLLESGEPTAFYRNPDGRVMYYWIFTGQDGGIRPGFAKDVSA